MQYRPKNKVNEPRTCKLDDKLERERERQQHVISRVTRQRKRQAIKLTKETQIKHQLVEMTQLATRNINQESLNLK